MPSVQTLLVVLVGINIAPALFGEQRELFIADFTIAICVHIPVKFLHVLKADLEPEEVNGLGELIDRDRL